MRTQHALTAPGGAGGEQNVGDIVRAHRSSTGIDLRRRGLWAGHEFVPGAVIGIERHPDDMSQHGQRVAIEIGHPVMVEEPAHPDQQRGLGAGQDVGGFIGGVTGVQRNQHRAGVVDRQTRDDPVPGIGTPDRDPIARGYPESGNHRSRSADLGVQFGEGERAVAGDDRVVVGEVARHPVENRRRGEQWPGGRPGERLPGIRGHRCSSRVQTSKCLVG